MSIDKIQIRSLCRPDNIFEGDYVNVMGLLQRVRRYYVRPIESITLDVIKELEEDEDIIQLETCTDTGLFVVKTVLDQETLTDILDDLIEDEFEVTVHAAADIPDDPFAGVPAWDDEQ